jgi:hypothetical protein
MPSDRDVLTTGPVRVRCRDLGPERQHVPLVPAGVAVSDRRERCVARGPVTGTDWCVLDKPQPEHLAPGRVVLCHEGTLTPHPEAERAAASAWEILARWHSRQLTHLTECVYGVAT